MSEQTLTPAADVIERGDLLSRFPDYVTRDERSGYEGYIIQPDKLREVFKAVRDEMGYDYLSSVTGVDYLPENLMEVVYHAFKTTGGPALVFKTQVARDQAGHAIVA